MSQINLSPNRKGDSPFKSPTAYQLRALVLDYLCHYCYANTAKAFIRDSTVKELDADGDEVLTGTESSQWPSISPKEAPEVLLHQVERRQEIRELILAGDIDAAIEKLREHFPSVLSSDTPSVRISSSIQSISSSLPSTSSNSLLGLRLDSRNLSSTPTRDAESYTFPSNTTIAPSHLLLNLKIQAFVESCRTVPLERPPPKVTVWSRRDRPLQAEVPSEDMDVDGGLSNTNGLPTLSSPEPTPLISTSPSVATSKSSVGLELDSKSLEILLEKGRKLYALANSLPDFKTRETYKKELENVGGLLIYKIPEESPVSRYLSYERREATAEQVNRAILYRTEHSPIPIIEVLARYTTAVWQEAKEQGARPRPGAVLPPSGVRSPALPPGANQEELPTFDLKQFLDAKSRL